MNKTTEALKLAEGALNAMLTHMGMDEDEWTKPTFNQAREALADIREALAEHSGDANERVAEPYACEAGECPDKSLCAGACECLFKAEPVKHEPVAEIHQYGMYRTLGSLNLPIGTKLDAAPVSAKREWVDLTDDEIEAAVLSVNTTMEAWITYRAVIAKFKEKNK